MEKELYIRLQNLVLEIRGKEKASSEQVDEMYNLNNIIFPDLKEFNKSCPSCRERVYKRIIVAYDLEEAKKK